METGVYQPEGSADAGAAGQPTLSLQEALAGAAGQPVAVQPLLLLPGRAYEEIKSEVQAQRHCFPKIRLGKPLVSAQEDLRALAAALNRAYPAVAGETLVLVGHGTDHKAGAAYVRLQAMFHAGGRGDIRVVTLKERLEKKALFSELKAVAPACIWFLYCWQRENTCRRI